MLPGEETPGSNNPDMLPAVGNCTSNIQRQGQQDPPAELSNLAEASMSGELSAPNTAGVVPGSGDGQNPLRQTQSVTGRNPESVTRQRGSRPPLYLWEHYVWPQQRTTGTQQQTTSQGSRGVARSPTVSGPASSRLGHDPGEGSRPSGMGHGESWEWLQEHYLLNPVLVGSNNEGDGGSEMSDVPNDGIYNAAPPSPDQTDSEPDEFEDGLRSCIPLDNITNSSPDEVKQVPSIKHTVSDRKWIEYADSDTEWEEVEETTNLVCPVPTGVSPSTLHTALEEFPRYKPQTSMVWPERAETSWGMKLPRQDNRGEAVLYNGPDPNFDLGGHLIEGAQRESVDTGIRDSGTVTAPNDRTAMPENNISRSARQNATNLEPAIRPQAVRQFQTSPHQHFDQGVSGPVTPVTTYPTNYGLRRAHSTTEPSDFYLSVPRSSPAVTGTNGHSVVGPSSPPLTMQLPTQSPYLVMSPPRFSWEEDVPGHCPRPDTDERLAGLYPTGSPSVFWERPTLLHRQAHGNMAGAFGRRYNPNQRSISEPGSGRGSVIPSPVAPTAALNPTGSRYSPYARTTTPQQGGNTRIGNLRSRSATPPVPQNEEGKDTELA